MSAGERSTLRADDTLYVCEGDPASAEWVRWTTRNKSRFNGPFGDFHTRLVGKQGIVRMQPHSGLANVVGGVHGGAVMAFIDLAMFVGTKSLGHSTIMAGGVTVDCNVQFLRAADVDRPLDAIIEIARETGRFLFIRGTVEQSGDIVASFMGLLRKPAR